MEKIDAITEQVAHIMAGVRINATKWASGKCGCLPLALEDADLKIAMNNVLTSNERWPEPATVHLDITDETKQKDLRRLTKDQDAKWAAYHVKEAATEIGASMLVANVEAQYFAELNKQYIGFRN